MFVGRKGVGLRAQRHQRMLRGGGSQKCKLTVEGSCQKSETDGAEGCVELLVDARVADSSDARPIAGDDIVRDLLEPRLRCSIRRVCIPIRCPDSSSPSTSAPSLCGKGTPGGNDMAGPPDILSNAEDLRRRSNARLAMVDFD